ncbi:ComF family protein [Hahella sp. CCB-MM4]|uniref:ComF family protein n=1 Tax=Hahella sp. (strain CCB-MM4) TaxID=1926491 RepID=UPI00143D5D9C|nr:phosphoribosyltransferase family protein [Hahella sp. CCB-MM4]
MKYQECGYWAKPLAQAIYPEFKQAFGHLHNAVLMPVPMHESQYFIRRDNHAHLIAKHLAKYAGLPLQNEVVMKSRHTPRQAELSARMRRRNVKNSFSLTDRPPVSPIIIIDDVVTTGSTIDAMARQLTKGGATEIYGFSVARRSLE